MPSILLWLALLTAYATPTGATITWQQSAGWSCVYRNGSVMLDCQDRPAGAQRLTLEAHTGRDGAYVPRPGDTYQVVMPPVVVSAPLTWRVWLATVRR